MWKKGQSGNPAGRPPNRVDATRAILESFSTVATPERWLKIAETATCAAEEGDKYARQWLSDMMFGKDPHATLDVNMETNIGTLVLRTVTHADVQADIKAKEDAEPTS